MSYSPLELSDYFAARVRDMYPIPPGISIQLFDHNHGTGQPPEWHVQVLNVDHAMPWEAPWGALNGPDFARMFLTIARELESKFGVQFPRKEKA